VNVPYTDLTGSAINLASNERQSNQQQNQFVNTYNMQRWGAQNAYDQQNKPPSGGGGGGGAPPGYTFDQVYGFIPDGTNGGGGGYQPSQGEQAAQAGVDAFGNAAVNSITGAKSYTQQTPTTKYQGGFNQKNSLFGGKRGLFG
jgi:hypothetical protein